jgi:hypothetical protein
LFTALHSVIEERHGAQGKPIALHFRERTNGRLTAAAHATQECALGGDRSVCVEMIEPFADFLDAPVVGANFNADGPLANPAAPVGVQP